MATVEKGPSGSGMIERIRNLLLQPSATFETIAGESATVGGLYRGWVVPLVLFSVACGAVGALAFGQGMMGFQYRPPFVAVLVEAVLGLILQLVMVYVMALVIDALAPRFGGEKNRVQAFKVSAYGGTAAWLAGVFGLFPPLAFLGLLGLYSVYLFYRGLPRLMKAPQEKAVGYTAAVVIIVLVLSIIGGLVVGAVAGAARMGAMMPGAASREITAPDGRSIDLAELEKTAKAFEQGATTPKAVDPELFKAYLPETVAGFTRTELSAANAGAGGLSGSGAEGRYSRGQSSLRLSLTDVGSAAPLAAMARALNVSSSTEADGRYEKVGEVDGRMVRERFNRDGGHGQYSVLVADRFMVEASGDGVTMAELKAAVASIDLDELETLAGEG